jgi:hypothetical protein
MQLPKKIGDTEPVPHKVKVGPANIVCDHCNQNIRVKFDIEKISHSRYLDFFTCPKCLTRYNVSVITRTGIKLRNKLKAMSGAGVGGKEYASVMKRYQTMVQDPEVRVVRPEAQLDTAQNDPKVDIPSEAASEF